MLIGIDFICCSGKYVDNDKQQWEENEKDISCPEISLFF